MFMIKFIHLCHIKSAFVCCLSLPNNAHKWMVYYILKNKLNKNQFGINGIFFIFIFIHFERWRVGIVWDSYICRSFIFFVIKKEFEIRWLLACMLFAFYVICVELKGGMKCKHFLQKLYCTKQIFEMHICWV